MIYNLRETFSPSFVLSSSSLFFSPSLFPYQPSLSFLPSLFLSLPKTFFNGLVRSFLDPLYLRPSYRSSKVIPRSSTLYYINYCLFFDLGMVVSRIWMTYTWVLKENRASGTSQVLFNYRVPHIKTFKFSILL